MPLSQSHASWQPHHVGYWLRVGLERFESRVLELLAQHPATPLALAHLVARGQVGAAHLHIARHLPPEGARLSQLASSAGMSKQAMAGLVRQCTAWGMVQQQPDHDDARARLLVYTQLGHAWLQAYRESVTQALAEFHQAVGEEVATVVAIGLEAYCAI